MKALFTLKPVFFCMLFLSIAAAAVAQNTGRAGPDEQVQDFLEEHRQEWEDLNVPYEDGRVLHDLIVKNNYQSALEIGTSTGHSTIWIAWALSKTGGKLITIEIDPQRQRQAISNLKAAGLSDFVEFRLGDAHELVKELAGPFDFVFSDADKEWYVQYFKDLDPKLKQGGRFTAHNVLQQMDGIQEYMEYITAQPGYETIVDRSSSSGIAISLKK